MDATIKRIFEQSEKAELLESISAELDTCHRVVVCLEKRRENDRTGDFQYMQLGFQPDCAVFGFQGMMDKIVVSAGKE